MKKENEKKKTYRSEEQTDFIIGLCTVLAVLAIFTAIIVFSGNKTSGTIANAAEIRRGTAQTFTYNTKNVKKGDIVNWYVDGQKLATYRYDGEDISFTYIPTTTGTATIKVVAGKTSQSKMIEVKKPILTISATDAEITYGEDMPQLTYTVAGLVDDDCADCVNCEIECDGDISTCGTYDIYLKNAECADYEVRCENAVLTVKPKQLAAMMEKVYDRDSTIDSPYIVLDGILENDEVFASAESVDLGGKNAGDYTVSAENIVLSGKDSGNYILSEAQGKILPREIVLEGLTVADKKYDGTSKATIAKMGTLNGVLEGDSVAVGSLDVSFENATEGTQKVNVKNVVLVGYDKDNYVLSDVTVNDAEIK